MSSYRYLVCPFVGVLKQGVVNTQSASNVSTQLQAVIDQYTSTGWEFYRIDNVDVALNPGCLAQLFGAKVSYFTLNQVIFRRLEA